MTTDKRSHRAASEMFPLIEASQASELSQKQFCQEQNLSLAVFQYWLKKYKSQQDPVPAEGFVAMKVQQSPLADSGVEIIYSDGTKLRFNAGAKMDQIRQVLPVFLQR